MESRNSPRTCSAAQWKSLRRYSASNKGRFGRVGRRNAVEQLPDIRVARGLGPNSPGGQEVDHQVAGDPEQSAAERTTGRVGIIAVDRPGHRTKDVLRQVGRIRLLKPLGTRQPVDQGRVDHYEFRPRPARLSGP